MNEQEHKGTDDVSLGELSSLAHQLDELNAMVNGGVLHGKVRKGDQAINAGYVRSVRSTQVNDQPEYLEVATPRGLTRRTEKGGWLKGPIMNLS